VIKKCFDEAVCLSAHPIQPTAAQRLKSAAADKLELSTRGFQPSAAFELLCGVSARS
jgi:hypothetical protein